MDIKKLIFAAVAAATVAGGAAIAQPYGYDRGYDNGYHRGYDRGGGWVSINQREAQLDRRIDRGVQTGQLTRREAYVLRSQFNRLVRLEARYRYNGLSNWERADLDRRFDNLSDQIRAERHDGERYGYNDYRPY